MSGAAPSRRGVHLGTLSPVMREFRGVPDWWPKRNFMEIKRPIRAITPRHCGFCGAARCLFDRSNGVLQVLGLSSEPTLCISRAAAVTNLAISII